MANLKESSLTSISKFTNLALRPLELSAFFRPSAESLSDRPPMGGDKVAAGSSPVVTSVGVEAPPRRNLAEAVSDISSSSGAAVEGVSNGGVSRLPQKATSSSEAADGACEGSNLE
jgi:hypothetical protein